MANKKNKSGWYSFVRWFPGEWYVETMAMEPVTLCVYMRLAASSRNNDGRPGTLMTTLDMAATTAGVTLAQVWLALLRMTAYVSAGAQLVTLEVSEDGTNWTEIPRRTAITREKEKPDGFNQIRVSFAWIAREESEAKKARATAAERKRREREGDKTSREVAGSHAESHGQDVTGCESQGVTRSRGKSKSKSKSKSKNTCTETSSVQEALELKGEIRRETIRWDREALEIAGVSEADVERWQKAYPLTDPKAEVLKAQEWLRRNPRRMKRDLGKFVGNWLSRSQQDKEERGQRSEVGGQMTEFGDRRSEVRGQRFENDGTVLTKNPGAGGMGNLLDV